MPRTTLAACALLALLAGGAAAADDRTQTFSGNRLELRMSCAVRVDIQPGPALSGKVEVTAHGGDAPALHLSGGETVSIDYHPSCGFDPDRLDLDIRVPPGMPIDVREAVAGDYDIGPVGGPLRMRLSGAADIRADKLSSLDLDSSGAADIKIEQLDGPATIGLHGGGELTIENGTMPKLKVESHGAADIEVAAGEIAELDISMAGAGNAEIHAAVKDASLDILGIGRIAVDKVTGKARRSIIGLGAIDIDNDRED